MVAAYSVAVETLSENLRWILSQRGLDVLLARSEYLEGHRLTRTNADDARVAIVAALTSAEPVFWPKPFCSIIEESFGVLPDSWRLTDPMLFTQQGFMHFEKPILLRSSHPQDDPCPAADDEVAGLTWRRVTGTLFVELVVWVRPCPRSIFNVFPIEWLRERVTLGTLRALKRATARLRAQSGPADADEEGDSVSIDALERSFVEAGLARAGGLPWMISPWRSGQTIEQTVMTYRQALTDDSAACHFCLRGYLNLFGACLNFLSTKVFVSVPSHTDRTTLRRAGRHQPTKPQWDTVNVVTLRRAERVKHESDEEHVDVDWSCHWMVSPHWRKQPVKNDAGEWTYEWRYIMPYIKGALDKPFKAPGKRVFDVAR